MNKMLLVPGHAGVRPPGTRSGGLQVHDDKGRPVQQQVGRSLWGHAKCSCGLLSPPLCGPLARTRWHRNHREQIAQVPWM